MATAETPVPAEAAVATPAPAPEVKELKKAQGRYVELSVKDIITKAGDNVRSGELPDIERLAESIAAEGILEPIIVTASTETADKFTVVAGHRRLTAVRSLGLPTIPALIIDADADRRLKLALIENIHRENMAPMDIAKGFSKLIKSTKLEQQEVAQAIGVAPGYVSQYLTLLDLPEAALSALRDGVISFTQARSLCRLIPNNKAIEELLLEAPDITGAALDSMVSHLVGLAKKAAAEAEPEAEADGEEGDAPKKPKKAKAPPAPDKAIEYYTEAEFHPLKKEDIRDLMIQYKRKELNSDTAKKREEYKLILKGITLAADLRLK